MKTQEEVQAERRQAEPGVIREVYEQIRRMVFNFYTVRGIQNIAPHIEQEDLIQECMIGWLEGQDVTQVLLEKYRSLMPYSANYYKAHRRKVQPVHMIAYEDANILPDDPLPEARIITHMDLAELMKRLDNVTDSRIKTVLELKYYYGMSLREMEQIMELKKSQIANLHNEGLEILRREEDDN